MDPNGQPITLSILKLKKWSLLELAHSCRSGKLEVGSTNSMDTLLVFKQQIVQIANYPSFQLLDIYILVVKRHGAKFIDVMVSVEQNPMLSMNFPV